MVRSPYTLYQLMAKLTIEGYFSGAVLVDLGDDIGTLSIRYWDPTPQGLVFSPTSSLLEQLVRLSMVRMRKGNSLR